MEITEKLLDTAKLLNRFIVPRYITGELISFAEEEGILKILSELKSFSLDEINRTLEARKEYRLDEPVRKKMMADIISLLYECGYLNRNGNIYSSSGGAYGELRDELGLTDEERTILSDCFHSQTSFIKKCLDYAPEFLRGSPPLYSFDGDSLDIWDSFLGNIEFSFARQLLLLNLKIKNISDFKFLDIGYGPGHGIISARELYPAIDITAVDFAGSFTSLVKEKTDAVLQSEKLKDNIAMPVKLIANSAWNGFGHPLPFPDDSFDAVFFTCADPYIAPDLREYVYGEIYRILRRGGSLGILTRAYPDAEFKYVKNHWTRRAVYCHDFAESVCEGWHGFYDVEESFRLFRKIGFSKNKNTAGEICMLDSAIWRLDKD